MSFVSYYKKKKVELGEKLGSGGEGDVFSIKDNDAVVVKLYNDHCRTEDRFKKLKRIIKKKMPYKQTAARRLAMPLDIIMDKDKFVGYVMPKVAGKIIKTTLFSKKKIETNYPNLTRRDLIELCVYFLNQIEYLHSKNILIGDINPQNLLIDKKDPKRCWIIDTDSFQVDEFPCPVGTDIFAPPRLQGVNFKDILRTKEDEYFSIAIMLFMILMTGKHPYSQVGGKSPASNIKSGNFPYKMQGKMENVPVGYFQYIWSYFTKRVKEAFIDVFANKKVITPKEWKDILNGYIYAVDNGYTSNLVYPLNFRPYGKDIISVVCEDCGKSFEVSAKWDIRLRQSGKNHKCGFCMQKVQASILANKTNVSKPTPIRNKNTTYNNPGYYHSIPSQNTNYNYYNPPKQRRSLLSRLFKFLFSFKGLILLGLLYIFFIVPS